MCKENEEVVEFMEKYEDIEPLIPRDAFFGGRTETFYTKLEAREDENIKYIDVR